MGLQVFQHVSAWLAYAVGLHVIAVTASDARYSVALPEYSKVGSLAGRLKASAAVGATPRSWAELLSKNKWLQKLGLGAVAGLLALALVLFTILGRSQLARQLDEEKQVALAEKDAEREQKLEELRRTHNQELVTLSREYELSMQKVQVEHAREVAEYTERVRERDIAIQEKGARINLLENYIRRQRQEQKEAKMDGRLEQLEKENAIDRMEREIDDLKNRADVLLQQVRQCGCSLPSGFESTAR
jgi:hypothetical protein